MRNLRSPRFLVPAALGALLFVLAGSAQKSLGVIELPAADDIDTSSMIGPTGLILDGRSPRGNSVVAMTESTLTAINFAFSPPRQQWAYEINYSYVLTNLVPIAEELTTVIDLAGYMAVLNTTTGHVKYAVPNLSQPVTSDGRGEYFYGITNDLSMSKIHVESGDVVWSRPIPDGNTTSPTIIAVNDGIVLLAGVGGFAGFDDATGEKRWGDLTVVGLNSFGLALGPTKFIVVGPTFLTSYVSVVVVQAQSGVAMQSAAAPGLSVTATVLDRDEKAVYIAITSPGLEGSVVALDTVTLATRWSAPISNASLSVGLVDVDANHIVASTMDSVRMLRKSDGAMVWHWNVTVQATGNFSPSDCTVVQVSPAVALHLGFAVAVTQLCQKEGGSGSSSGLPVEELAVHGWSLSKARTSP